MVLARVIVHSKKITQFKLGHENICLLAFAYGLSNAVPRDASSWPETNNAAANTMVFIRSSIHWYKQRNKLLRYYNMPVAYYSNSIAMQKLLIMADDISDNPSLTQRMTSSSRQSKQKPTSKWNTTKCDYCEKMIRRNQMGITCCVCISSFHLKCSGMTALSCTWLCSNCLGSALPFY